MTTLMPPMLYTREDREWVEAQVRLARARGSALSDEILREIAIYKLDEATVLELEVAAHDALTKAGLE